MIVELSVNCIECEEEIVHRSLHFSDDKTPRVNVYEFSQTDWVCSACGHTTSIRNVGIIDGKYDENEDE